MAGISFDDLNPGSAASTPPKPGNGLDFGDLASPPPTAEQERALRLRKIARATLGADPGAAAKYSDSFTLGLMKPVQGLATGLGNLVTGQSGFGEGYAAGTGAYQDYLDEASKNSGWAGTAADVAGSVTAGGPARGAITEGLWPMVKSAVGLGAVEGAARNSEDLGSAAKGAVIGGVTGGATAGVIGGAQSLAGRFGARRAASRAAAQGPGPDELKDSARALYKQLDQANIAYDNNQATQLVDDAISDLKQNAWSPTGVHSPLNGVIKNLEDMRGQPMSLEKLQNLREQIGSEAGANEPQVRRIAGRLLGSIDGFVRNVDPAMSSIPRDQVGPLWGQARQLWRSANTAEDIGWRLSKAERRAASTNSGQNEENAIRQNVRSALDKGTQPRRYNPYSGPEMAQMEKVVRGTPVQNATRWAGNQVAGIPAGAAGVLGGAGVGASMLGLPHDAVTSLLLGGAGLAGSAGMTGLGHAIKGQSTKMAQDEADKLMRLIATGTMEALPAQGPPTREALARIMRLQQATRGPSIAVARYFGGDGG